MSEASRAAMDAYYTGKYGEILERAACALASDRGDEVVMLGPSGCVFRFGGEVFAVDPAIRRNDGPKGLEEPLVSLFMGIPDIFITHNHSDHFDRQMTRVLAGLPARWIIPEFIKSERIEQSGLRPENIIYVTPGDEVRAGRVRAEVFKGMHRDADGIHGTDAVGYRFTAGGRSIIFLADVRRYDPANFQAFSKADCVFVNVWLGRESALAPDEELVEGLARLAASFAPEKVFLGHLYETGRLLIDMWDYGHAGLVMDKLLAIAPGIEAVITKPGCRYSLLD